MTRASRDLLHDALALPDGERLELASELIASVDGPADANWEATWTAEIDRRISVADATGTPADDWVSVRARVLSKLAPK